MIITDYIRGRLININLRRTLLYTAIITLLLSPFVNFFYHWPAISSHHHRQRQQRAATKTPANIHRHRVSVFATVSNSTSPPLPCDDECLRFGRLLDSWPTNKPKAAVILLLGPWSITAFARSSRMFSINFNNEFNYPVIVFHEDNIDNTASYRRRLRSLTNSSLYFQVWCLSSCWVIRNSVYHSHVQYFSWTFVIYCWGSAIYI